MKKLFCQWSFTILSLFSSIAAGEQKQTGLEEIVNSPVLSTSQWGAYFVDADTNQEIYSHQANRLFMPASVTKLFTAALAFEYLGDEFDFTTQVKGSVLPDNAGVLKGNLYLIGSGDPSLDSDDLYYLAQQVYENGVRTILGTVIADDSLMQGASLPTHGEWEDLPYYYSPEISALSVDSNAVKVIISPNEEGKGIAEVIVQQKIPYCTLLNRVETTSDATTSLVYSRGLTDNIIEISGTIAAQDLPKIVQVAIHEPKEYARQIFLNELQSLGITVLEGQYKDKPIGELQTIARVYSPPLYAQINYMNKFSDNFTAEMLFKYIGVSKHPLIPANQGCLKATTSFFDRLNIPSTEYSLYDGSGLSRHNLLSPQHIVRLLKHADESWYHEEFLSSLPINGVDGTLAKRLANRPPKLMIRAKTGSMSGIVTLAGFVEMPNERRILFAICINNSVYKYAETSSALDTFLLQLLADL